jgi:spermidine synthase
VTDTAAPPSAPPGAAPREPAPTGGRLLLPLVFASGFAALVYQVLWVREVGLLVGATAQAAALTIAIFFTGIALGGWWWGRRAPRSPDPLRAFGLLEVGVAVTALGHFVLVDAYAAVYPLLHGVVGTVPALDTAAKALVAAIVLLPPSVLMGGTLPMIGQHLVRGRARLGRTGSALYAVNTAGAASGALAAGLALPLLLGLDGAYLLAVAVDLTVGLTCVLLARRARPRVAIPAVAARGLAAPEPPRGAGAEGPHAALPPPGRPHAAAPHEGDPGAEAPRRGVPQPAVPQRGAPRPAAAPPLPAGVVWAVAGLSGVATLAVEVLWTRLLSQVLQNSAATYALVLTSFLLALALGAGVANGLARQRRVPPAAVLTVLLLAAGTATAASPWLIDRLTDGLAYLGGDLGWYGYVLAVVALAVPVLVLPGTALGAVLPSLLRLLEDDDRAPGEVLGRLLAVNTAGAVVGALAAGFVLLPTLGAWRSLLVVAAVYPALAAAVLASRASGPVRLPRLAAAGTAGLLAVGLVAVDLQGVAGAAHAPVRESRGERLVEAREGPQANVAVIGRGADRLLRVDSTYTLGGSRGRHTEQDQTVLPLLADGASSVFYLGMGTGITAGAAMPFPVEEVVVCELIADVVDLAEQHFGRWVNGLFTDPRVTVHAEDGRGCLRRDRATYDLVISDLFTPWQAGTGSLYTVEHYRTARQRLAPGGRMVQWVPLYQVSERELAIIAATMAEVFPQVTLWRGDLLAERSIVALVGHDDDAPLDPTGIAARAGGLPGATAFDDAALEALVLRHYAGNVTAAGLFADAPRNTDRRPLVEHLAPRTHREVRAGTASFVVGPEREELYAALRTAVDVDADPHLARLDARQRGYVRAGDLASRAALLEATGQDAEAAALRAEEARLVPAGALAERSPSRALLGR